MAASAQPVTFCPAFARSCSGQLKYKLLCGSVVFKFESEWLEFFEYPVIKPGAGLRDRGDGARMGH